MNNSNRLLEIYMQKLSLHTLNEVASKLSVTRPAVSNWKAGTSHPNAEAIETMCKATGEPIARWLPLIESDRCRTAGDRRAWLRLAQVAAAVALTVGLTPAHSAPVSTGHNPVGTVYYVKFWKVIRKTGTRIASLLAHLKHGGSRVQAPHPLAVAV